ncbi:SPOR domain-containing protein, partial [Roseomonas alkaliterrae]
AQWAVQVGAFSSENLARTSANQAREVVATLGSRTSVTPVRQGNTTLYRARVTGLTRSAAEQACNRLRARGACTVVAPGA